MKSQRRRGVLIPLAAILMVMMVGVIAFAIDLGYIVLVRTELQCAADYGALGGCMTKRSEQ